MKTIVCVMSDAGDGQQYQIGSVMLQDLPADVDAQMQEWWEQFRDDCPTDQDSEFIDWLIGSHAKQTPVEVTYAKVNS